jgi:hypothetical protein
VSISTKTNGWLNLSILVHQTYNIRKLFAKIYKENPANSKLHDWFISTLRERSIYKMEMMEKKYWDLSFISQHYWCAHVSFNLHQTLYCICCYFTS